MSPRVLVAIPLIAVATLVLGVVAIIVGVFDGSGRATRAVGCAWARWVLWVVGIRVDVSGAENVPEGPAVYAANHGSAFDIPILLAYLPVDLRLIHKRSLYLVPVLGWSLWFGGHIAIDRRNPFRAQRSLAAAAVRVRKGARVAVFPEGTRSPDAAVRPFKKGAFVLAAEAEVPVVPLSLDGVKRVLPRGLFTLRPGRVRLRIHPAVATAGRTADRGRALAEEVRQIVAAGCVGGVA